MEAVVGRTYSWAEVQKHWGGEQTYLSLREGRIICATLDARQNPQAPRVVVVGHGSMNMHRAEVLCRQKESIPVFIKESTNQWRYEGRYKFDHFITDPREVKQYQTDETCPLSRVIFLRPAGGQSGLHLSALTFQRQFRRFETQVRRKSDTPFTSFRDGLPAQMEDYKGEVRKHALRLLGFRAWRRAEVGTGRILERVIRAIEINDTQRGLRNNLVAWIPRHGAGSRSHLPLLSARSDATARRKLEGWFLDFFQDRLSPPEAFEKFCDLTRRRYDVPAYLFFLKDWTRFMPIAPTTFDRAFRLLDIDLVTSGQCSWANYERYNAALGAVQRALQEVAGIADARLIDAQTFCWMLVRLASPTVASVPDIAPPRALPDVAPVPSRADTSGNEDEFDIVDEEEFARRDVRRRQLGRLAQDVALRSEQRRLREAGHPIPETAARPVWDQPGRGYDILSCELDGTARHIEVKAARQSGRRFSFFLSENERVQSRSQPNYHFYLVTGADSARPVTYDVEARQITEKCLVPVNYRATICGRRMRCE